MEGLLQFVLDLLWNVMSVPRRAVYLCIGLTLMVVGFYSAGWREWVEFVLGFVLCVGVMVEAILE